MLHWRCCGGTFHSTRRTWRWWSTDTILVDWEPWTAYVCWFVRTHMAVLYDLVHWLHRRYPAHYWWHQSKTPWTHPWCETGCSRGGYLWYSTTRWKPDPISFLEIPVGQPFMSALYQVAPGITYNKLRQGAWTGPGQWYGGVEGGNITDLNIYFMAIITTTREIHESNKIIGIMLSVIIASSRKVTLVWNISTNLSGTCLARRRVHGGIWYVFWTTN